MATLIYRVENGKSKPAAIDHGDGGHSWGDCTTGEVSIAKGEVLVISLSAAIL